MSEKYAGLIKLNRNLYDVPYLNLFIGAIILKKKTQTYPNVSLKLLAKPKYYELYNITMTI